VEGGGGATVADFPAGDLTKWEVGHNSTPNGGIRAMYKPSLDGVSADGWYDGLATLDVHYTSGPVNRMFFFLAAGASNNPNSPAYSVWLPGGMTGIGNDRAARIWYKTLTEYLPSNSGFETARAASLLAATDLYGQASPEYLAVMSAWAAVNVGSAPGQPPRVRITMPITNGPGSFLFNNAVPTGILAKVQFYPTRARVNLHATVTNTPDQKASFSLPDGLAAGQINDDGSWSTPAFDFYSELLPITATSHADPTQFAKGQVLLLDLDADTDGESDALDLGAVAVAWGVNWPPSYSVLLAGMGSVSDWDLAFFNEAMVDGWPVK
jgi:hypothetical protein